MEGSAKYRRALVWSRFGSRAGGDPALYRIDDEHVLEHGRIPGYRSLRNEIVKVFFSTVHILT